MDKGHSVADINGSADSMDVYRKRAYNPHDRRRSESVRPDTRADEAGERYGMHRYGQRALLARRLVEAGVSFVTMVMENPSYPGESFPTDVTYNWDSHAVNCHIFTDTKYRLAPYDRAVTALIEDLYNRGLDKRVLLIVTGEFGRTPRISYSNGRPGRDHWPQAMSLLVSGGGLKTGQVVGSTNAKGEDPKDRPLSVNDLWATMFRHLNIDYKNTSFLDHPVDPCRCCPKGNRLQSWCKPLKSGTLRLRPRRPSLPCDRNAYVGRVDASTPRVTGRRRRSFDPHFGRSAALTKAKLP